MADPEYDKRITPVRSQMAAAHLKDRFDRPHYIEGQAARIYVDAAPVYYDPRPDSQQVTQFLFGEAISVYDAMEGYAFVQASNDGYVGWVAETALLRFDDPVTHRVHALRSHLYTVPDVKAPVQHGLPMGAQLSIGRMLDGYAILSNGAGAVPEQHIQPIDKPEQDWVAVAARFEGTPYLWGGKTASGIDCSGLVQVALHMAGQPCPRDTDMQRDALGTAVAGGGFQRGDLVFWRGHVGIMLDETRLLHANAHHMATAIEPVAETIARLEAGDTGPVTAIKRL